MSIPQRVFSQSLSFSLSANSGMGEKISCIPAVLVTLRHRSGFVIHRKRDFSTGTPVTP